MNLDEKFRFICENNALDQLAQECSGNLDFATMGGAVWWDLLAEVDGWKLQQNKLTSHVRILNPSNVRKAWGSRRSIESAIDLVGSQIRAQQFVSQEPADHQTVSDKEGGSLVARLEKLQLLLDKGLIMPEEFNVKKAAILDEI